MFRTLLGFHVEQPLWTTQARERGPRKRSPAGKGCPCGPEGVIVAAGCGNPSKGDDKEQKNKTNKGSGFLTGAAPRGAGRVLGALVPGLALGLPRLLPLPRSPG